MNDQGRATRVPAEIWGLIVAHALTGLTPCEKGAWLETLGTPGTLSISPRFSSAERQAFIVAMCLVSWQCYYSSVAWLYRDPVIKSHNNFMLLLRTLITTPRLAALVRNLNFCQFRWDTFMIHTQHFVNYVSDDFFDRYLQHAARYVKYISNIENGDQARRLTNMYAMKTWDGLEEQTCKAVLLSFLPGLRRLKCRHAGTFLCPGTEAGQLPSLVWAEVSHPRDQWYRDHSFSHLRWLALAAPNLKTLVLRNLRQDAALVPSPVEDPSVPRFQNVTCLSLVDCYLEAQSLWTLLQGFPALEQLDILCPRCIPVAKEVVDTIWYQAPYLADFRMRFSHWHDASQMTIFHRELTKTKLLRRLYLPMRCFAHLDRADLFVESLPLALQHLSIEANCLKHPAQRLPAEVDEEVKLMEGLQAVADNAREPDSRLPWLMSVTVTKWAALFGRPFWEHPPGREWEERRTNAFRVTSDKFLMKMIHFTAEREIWRPGMAFKQWAAVYNNPWGLKYLKGERGFMMKTCPEFGTSMADWQGYQTDLQP